MEKNKNETELALAKVSILLMMEVIVDTLRYEVVKNPKAINVLNLIPSFRIKVTDLSVSSDDINLVSEKMLGLSKIIQAKNLGTETEKLLIEILEYAVKNKLTKSNQFFNCAIQLSTAVAEIQANLTKNNQKSKNYEFRTLCLSK